ncbi:TolC family protein [Sphingomonas sp. NCPPB 2930]|uniref:TolC family protein n=1 Tax=Sphingomonas sp. NCPPB 2930 TaxID=3162788 RepID=UPI0036D7D33B
MTNKSKPSWYAGNGLVLGVAIAIAAQAGGAEPRSPNKQGGRRSAAAAAPTTTVQPDAQPSAVAKESLRDAIVASLKQNPDIQIALAQQDDAKYGVNEARAAYLPRVDMTLASGPEYVQPNAASDSLLQRREGVLNIHQNLWDFGVTINDIKRANAAYASARWGTRKKIEQISFEISSAYLGVLEKQKLVDLIGEEIETQAKMSKMIAVQKDLGLTTSADVSRAQVRQDNLQQLLLDAQSQLQQQREAYRRLTGRLPDRATDLPPVDSALPPNPDSAVDVIEQRNPDLAQASQDRRSIERQLASQKGNFFPRIGLDLQGNHRYEVLGRTGRADDARAVVTISYNLLNGGADMALKRRIEARLREADYQLLKVRRDVEQDLRVDFQSLKAANEKMTTIESQIDAAQKVVTLYREQFRSGQRSVFDLLDSQQALFQAKQNQLSNYTQKQVSGLRVLQKMAELFRFVGGGEPPPLSTPAPIIVGVPAR